MKVKFPDFKIQSATAFSNSSVQKTIADTKNVEKISSNQLKQSSEPEHNALVAEDLQLFNPEMDAKQSAIQSTLKPKASELVSKYNTIQQPINIPVEQIPKRPQTLEQMDVSDKDSISISLLNDRKSFMATGKSNINLKDNSNLNNIINKEQRQKIKTAALQLKQDLDRIPIRDIYKKMEENNKLLDQINQAKARLQKLQEEKNQSKVQTQQIQTHIAKINDNKVQKSVLQQQKIQTKQEIEEQIEKKKLQNEEMKARLKNSVVDSKLKVIQENQVKAQELRFLSQQIKQQKEVEEQAVLDKKRSFVQTIKEANSMNANNYQTRVNQCRDRIKQQYYSDQYNDIQVFEQQRKEYQLQLVQLQEQEKALLMQAIDMKENRSKKIQELDQLLQGM